MTLRLRLIISFLIFFVTTLYSQSTIVTGTVIDKSTKKTLAGVSVQVESSKTTITDSKGNFRLQVDKQLLLKHKICFTYIGYQDKCILYQNQPTGELTVALEMLDNMLTDITVSTIGNTIIEKAISKISQNYPNKPIISTGLSRIYNIVNDSDYFYKSDGIIQTYFSSYTDYTDVPKTKVIQNKYILQENSRSPFYNNFKKTMWVGGYYSALDFVHIRPDFLILSKLSQYRYKKLGDTLYNNRKTYIIHFEDKKENIVEGALFIDSITYAFAGADITWYNITHAFLNKISVSKTRICYEINGDKWYLKSSHAETKNEHPYDNSYITDIVYLSVDTSNIKPFFYNEVSQRTDENIKVLKQNTKESWRHYDSLFFEEELSGRITTLPAPKAISQQIDESKVIKESSIFSNSIHNGNLRITLGITRFPFSVVNSRSFFYYQSSQTNFLASGSRKISDASNLGFEISSQFQIFKHSYIDLETNSNFGIGGLNNNEIQLSLEYDFVFNERHRPMYIVPKFCIGNLQYSESFGKYYANKLLINDYTFINKDITIRLIKALKFASPGCVYNLEISRKKSLFLGTYYNFYLKEKNTIEFLNSKGVPGFKKSESIESDNTGNQSLPLINNHFEYSIGLQLKL